MSAEYKVIMRGSFYGGPVTYGPGKNDRLAAEWRVEILRYTDFLAEVWELTFPDESPLVIEWMETKPEDAIQGSMATLRIISPGDRSFLPFVTVDSGPIVLKVYQGALLYWRGVMDVSDYSEPYEKGRNYEVSVRFTDFGSLKNLDYTRPAGNKPIDSLERILAHSLAVSGLFTPAEIDAEDDLSAEKIPSWWQFLDSTRIGDFTGKTLSLADVCCRTDNFFDEEGTPMTLYDALETLAKPVGIKLVQRGGIIRCYDLCTLIDKGQRAPICWTGDAQTLTSGQTYNRVTVNYSPYVRSELIAEDLTPDETEEAEGYPKTYALSQEVYLRESPAFTVHASATPAQDLPFVLGGRAPIRYVRFAAGWKNIPNCVAIDMLTGSGYPSLDPTETGPGLSPYFNGSSATQTYPAAQNVAGVEAPAVTISPRTNRIKPAYVSERIWLPPNLDRSRYRLKVSVELLLDTRVNPFAGLDDDGGNPLDWNLYKTLAGFLYMPIALALYDNHDILTPKAFYQNRKNLRAYSDTTITEKHTPSLGWTGYYGTGWVQTAANGNGNNYVSTVLATSAFAAWWSDSPKDEKPATDGWTMNRTPVPIFPHGEEVDEAVRSSDDGMIIPIPPDGGWLELRIYPKIYGYSYTDFHHLERYFPNLDEDLPQGLCRQWDLAYLHSKLRWFCVRNPKVTLVDSWRDMSEVELEDLSYEGYVGNAPREELTVSTNAGTMPDPHPASLGQLLDLNGFAWATLTRKGVTECPEKMLIGTCYSQYRQNRVTLTGEQLFPPMMQVLYTDAAGGAEQGSDSVFMATAETLDCRRLTADTTFTQIFPEIYTASLWKDHTSRGGFSVTEVTEPPEPETEPGGELPGTDRKPWPSVYGDNQMKSTDFYGPIAYNKP